MDYKYIKLATNEDLSNHNKYLKLNLYNEKYKHLFGGNYLIKDIDKIKNDGWNDIAFNITNGKTDKYSKIIGLVRININRGTLLTSLNGIHIIESYIGKGYGKKAMVELLHFCKSRFTRLELTTSDKKLVDFYKSFGFRLVGKYEKRLVLTDYKVYDDYAMEILFKNA